MPGGYMGRILLVDLTSGFINEEKLPEKIYQDFIGGLGLGVRILYERMRPGGDPLGPDNWIGFVTGPLTGTATPASARFMVVTKSPLTETWCDSNSGGYFGPELKAAGYDGIFLTGTAPSPVYLWVHNGHAELRDAKHLWGKDTVETEEILQQELSDSTVKVVCIGPAGELLSLLAAIMHDGGGRSAARGGAGAVMGSKKLKAIVVKGHTKVSVANSQRITVLKRGVIKDLSVSKMHKMLRTQGTSGAISSAVVMGFPGIKNWTLIGEQGMPNHAKIDGPEVNKYKIKAYACSGCPISCGGILEVKSGPYSVKEAHRPEYESIASLGAMCLNANVESIIKANDICNRYGLDTISAGSAIAFAMECYERGIIGKRETDGVELTWGNSPAIVTMLEKMAWRRGFGDVLADGVKKAAERIGRGAEECAIHIHGIELPMHDPRIYPGRGTLYVADANPGRHTIGALPAAQDRGAVVGPYSVLQTPRLDTFGDYLAKGPTYILGADYFLLFSSAGLCMFAGQLNTYPLVEFISAITGWDFSPMEGLTAGRRISTLRHCFNIREGLDTTDFRIPDRLAKPASMGPYAGITVDFDAMKGSYYAAMHWDLKTGKPYRRTLVDLGLDELTKDLMEEAEAPSQAMRSVFERGMSK